MIKIYQLILLIFVSLNVIAQESVHLLIVYPDSFENSAKAYAKVRSSKVETALFPLSEAGPFPNERELRSALREYRSEFPFNHLLLIGSVRNIPLHLSENGTFTDYYYSQMDDDDMPDIAVGRIPAKNQKEIRTYLSKVEQAQNQRPLQYSGGLILTGNSEADNKTGNSVGKWMKDRSYQIKESLPSESEIIVWKDSISELLIFQIGLGTATSWVDLEKPFTIREAEIYHLPYPTSVVSIACSTSGIHHTNNLASTLLFNQQSGVVSYIGCTGNCLVKWADNIGFYILQASDLSPTIGSALMEAEKVFPSLSVMANDFEKTHTLNQIILLGDPSLPLPHPQASGN